MKKQEIVANYLKLIFGRTSTGRISFDPWNILQDLSLARELVEPLCNKLISSNISGICALAKSGVPLGVMLSRCLNLPLYVFHRNPISIDDLPNEVHIYPEPNQNLNIALVDSHINSGYTSSFCYDYLTKKGIKVKNIISPISFLEDPDTGSLKYTRDTEYYSLSNSSEHSKLLLEICNAETMSDVVRFMSNRIEESKTDKEKEQKFLPRKLKRFEGIAKSFFISKKRINFKCLDAKLSTRLKNEFSSEEAELWKLFTRPKLLEEICTMVGKQVSINSFPILIGIHILGTLFCISVAWHNNFKGKMYSTYQPDALDSRAFGALPEGYLMITGRIRTGVYIRGAIEELKKYRLELANVLALRLALDGVQFPRNSLIYSQLNGIERKIYFVS
jgi:adenine/guanine phosphoribosyltransferase-like PRPP-binding protein